MDLHQVIIWIFNWMMNANLLGNGANIWTSTLFLFWIVYPLNMFRKRVGILKGLFLSAMLAYAVVIVLDYVYWNFTLITSGNQTMVDYYVIRSVWVISTAYFALRFCYDCKIFGKELKIASVKSISLVSAYFIYVYWMTNILFQGMTYRSQGILPFPRWEMYAIGLTGWAFSTIVYVSFWHIGKEDSISSWISDLSKKINLRKIASRYLLFHNYARNVEREVFQKRLAKVDYRGLTLDAGCGDMGFINSLNITHAIGIDLNITGLKNAKRNYPNCSPALGDLRNMPFKNGTFETIISNSVFEHIPEPNLAVKEISRVSKKGGSIYFTIIPEETFISRSLETAIFKNENFLSEKQWIDMFAFNGFNVRKASFYSHKIMHDIYLLFCLFPFLLFTFPLFKLLSRLKPNVALYLECVKQ